MFHTIKECQDFMLSYCKSKSKVIYLSPDVWQKLQFRIMHHWIENQKDIGNTLDEKYMNVANGLIIFDGPNGPVEFKFKSRR
jgi:hypothetical protein